MEKFSTLIIGGGPAGIAAAISARREGKDVVICERMPQIGRKILVSGNGRCNILNEKLNESFYNQTARNMVRSIFEKFGKISICNFFKELGLEVYSRRDGRVFPITNQSSSVLKVLEMELERLSALVEVNFEVSRVSYSKGRFVATSKENKNIECEKLVIAGGGKSYPALGSDGNCYKLAKEFGHKIIEPVPAAAPLLVKDRLCHILQGQKIFALAKSIIGGKSCYESYGDLLFTKYGLSGTAIIDISEDISIAVNRHNKKDVCVSIDMVPFMDREALKSEIKRRIDKGWKADDLLTGILPNKFGAAFNDLLGKRGAENIINTLKNRLFKVAGTRGWNEAYLTSGGIDTKDIKESTLESKLVTGLYFAGEILDVSGRRGGYNLAWAWASGFVSGLTS